MRVVAVIGATENMPSGHAVKPGDIVRARRHHDRGQQHRRRGAPGPLRLPRAGGGAGAERLVDLATLTGAILVALGSTYAGLFANDDAWAPRSRPPARTSGELVWRLPLHAEYRRDDRGPLRRHRQLDRGRKAGSITAAEFLKRFVGDVPWAHLDIAGTAWDLERPYARKGGAGFGVRLLVDLAQRVACRD